MRRVLLISLSLVLAMVGWSMVCAEDGVYVIPTMKSNYAPVPKTGQTNPYGLTGTDGALQSGVAWPIPRFTDNHNGTVTDNLTKLIWTKNANIFDAKTWNEARNLAGTLHNGFPYAAGLTDGSAVGDWRLPNVWELHSLIDFAFFYPPLPNALGTGQWKDDDPFQNVKTQRYWSSTTVPSSTNKAWVVSFYDGNVGTSEKSDIITSCYVWCVRGGR